MEFADTSLFPLYYAAIAFGSIVLAVSYKLIGEPKLAEYIPREPVAAPALADAE